MFNNMKQKKNFALFNHFVSSLAARQCSKRGGDVTMDMGDDGRIDLTGNAVIVMSGKLKV